MHEVVDVDDYRKAFDKFDADKSGCWPAALASAALSRTCLCKILPQHG